MNGGTRGLVQGMTRTSTRKAIRASVRGVVQGVGFRPFVYRLAHAHNLAGWVRNTSRCVEIEVEGEEWAIQRFLSALTSEAPPVASIEDVSLADSEPRGYGRFEIEESHSEEGEYQLVSPDIATCRACQEEVFSPADRRYRYPFTNCTNCGPRFTIIEDIPYDRAKTTMRCFTMCPDCQREYDDPLDRRFHAQPNACSRCGPSLELVDNAGSSIGCSDPMQEAAGLLVQGKIVAVKGLGGFLIACDATNSAVVQMLRQRKGRPSKPFAVMMASLEEVRRHCLVSLEEERLLSSPQSPIVLLRWIEGSSVCREVAPEVKYLGVMLPYTPLHHLLMREVGRPLVMTSGNLSEEPIAKDNDEALRRLGNIAEYFLMHNREIYAKYDDSVCVVEGGAARVVRRARGYAPYPIFLPFNARQVLACGAEEKNTFCLTKDQHAFVSQHIGDMENEETLEHYESAIELFKGLFRIEPEVIGYDLHPEYLSTKYAMELEARSQPGLKFVPVQHHHAHLASCLAENGVGESVIGVVFDGTGYGLDGNLWGGEFLVGDWAGFERVGHLEYVPMPGGTAAVKKPYRMALGYLHALGDGVGEGLSPQSLRGLPLLSQIEAQELSIIRRQLEQGLNCPLTSSAGRLFDAVSALAGVRGTIDYEAQAAVELEMAVPDDLGGLNTGGYPFRVARKGGGRTVEVGDLIAAVVADVKAGRGTPYIAADFHKTMVRMIVQVCRDIAEERDIDAVALSGGVFQNRLLLRLTTEALHKEGFRVLTHRLVPCNDGGISLGQAVIAHFAVS